MATGGKEYQLAIKIAGRLDSSYTSAISRISSDMAGLGAAGKAVGASFKLTAKAMAATATAIAGTGMASVKTGSEFEAAMSSVSATANATEEEYAKLEAAALEMGRTTSKTASESAAALEYMALAGWSVDQSITGLPSILRLSEATSLDLATTSDLVTDSMSALGLTVDELAGYLDVAAKANNKSNQTAQQLMEAYLGVGGTMNNLNVPIAESATALGVLANRGIKGSEAGTALNAIMVNLTTGTGQAGKALKALGVSAFDSEGNFVGLEATLQDLNTALAGCTDEQRNAYLAAIGGKIHVDALNDLMAGLNTEVSDGVTEWSSLEKELSNANGALEQMASVKLDNLNGDMAIFKSALEDTEIAIYKNLQYPLRETVQFGTQEIYKLSDALKEGGLEGMLDAVGEILADCTVQFADGLPTFIDLTANVLEKISDSIDENAPQIGSALARSVIRLASALVRITPKMIVVGAHMIVEFLKGIKEHHPEIKAAAIEAVQYLMTEARSELKGYVDFLGDDEVAPFEKILALIPAVAAGFAGFKVIGGVVPVVNGLLSTFKGIGKSAPLAKRGIGGIGSSMSSMAKNILGAGVGLGLAAAGIWLLVDAAKAIVDAGPEAQTAFLLMIVGIAGLIDMASTMGPKLQASQKGLIAFGAAILLSAAGMAVLSFAAVQIAQAGPLALGALAAMEVGIIALMAVAGALGTQLATATHGLLAFGAAVVLAAAGMAIMAYSAIQLSEAGGPAIAVFAGLAVAVAAFIAVAALLGPMLISGGAGMILLGSGLLLAATGMALLANTAIQLSAAGEPALITMAALAAGVLAFGAASGLLAPLLLAGTVALAAFGAALAVVSAAAIPGSAAMLIISAALPALSEYGGSGAIAIAELGAAMVVFAAGAATAGAGAGVAALGIGALALAAAGADLAFAPLAIEMAVLSAAVAVIAVSAETAASGLRSMKDSSSGMITSMASLAVAFAPVTLAIVPFSAAVAAGTVAMAAFTISIVAVDAALVAILAEVLAISAGLLVINAAMAAFQVQARTIGTSVSVASTNFTRMTTVATPLASALMTIIGPMTAAGAVALLLATGMTGIAASAAAVVALLATMTALLVTVSAGFTAAGAMATVGMSQISSATRSGMTGIGTTATTAMTQMTTAVRSGMTSTQTVVTTSMTAIRVATTSDITATVMVIQSRFTQITATTTGSMTAMRKTVTTTLVSIRSEYTSTTAQMLVTTKTTFTGISNEIAQAMNRAVQAVSSAVATMRSTMNFSWSFPHLKVPHISVSGSFSIEPPSAPKFNVSWYKEGGILNGAQIFGMAGGNLLGGGEAGQEAVLPLSELWTQMRSIMAEVVSGTDTTAGISVLADRLEAMSIGNSGGSLADLADWLAGNKDDGGPAPGTGDGPTYQITYSPTFQFYGEAPSQEDMAEAARMSQDEFNDMMDEWVKTNRRKNF